MPKKIRVSYDSAKRKKTLLERGLDFKNVPEVLNGRRFTFLDLRHDYGEERRITVGFLEGRMVVVVWTMRKEVHHIISLRKANAKEQKYYKETLD